MKYSGKKSIETHVDLLIHEKNIKDKYIGSKRKRDQEDKDYKIKFTDNVFNDDLLSDNDRINMINNTLEEDDKLVDDNLKNNKLKEGNIFNSDFIAFNNKSENKIEKDEIRLCSDYPWLKNKTRKMKGMLKLHYEILDFYDFIKPNTEEDSAKIRTFNILESLIKEISPNWKVKTFGSFPNNIHLPDSDIDIIVLTEDKIDQLKILKKIAKKLTESKVVSYINLIEAKVPIIRAEIYETKNYVDISCNRKNGYEAKKVIAKILIDYPFIRPLIYVLKYFLRQKKLNEIYTGGLSSFLLLNLIFSYIQYLSKEHKHDENNMLSLGHLLVGFFQHYAFEFNYELIGISIKYGGSFYKKNDKEWFDFKKNNILSVENFQEKDQDIGKGSYKFRSVLDAFKQARDALYYPFRYPLESYLCEIIKPDEFIISRATKINN